MEPNSGRPGSSYEEGDPFLIDPQGRASSGIPQPSASSAQIRTRSCSPTRARSLRARCQGFRSPESQSPDAGNESGGEGGPRAPALCVRAPFPESRGSPGAVLRPKGRCLHPENESAPSGVRCLPGSPSRARGRFQGRARDTPLVASADARGTGCPRDSGGTSSDSLDAAGSRRQPRRSVDDTFGRGDGCTRGRGRIGLVGGLRSSDAPLGLGGAFRHPWSAPVGDGVATTFA